MSRVEASEKEATESSGNHNGSGNTISGAKGITFSGETFIVPETHDMVKTLFDPNIRKSICERIILVLLASNGIVFWLVGNNQTRILIFIGLYLFWRFSYNFGIGYLLYQQSNHNKLVNWAKNYHLFEENGTFASKMARREIKSQLGPRFDLSKYPIDFSTWLLFRKVVDLILMQDFTAFICLVVVCAISNDNQFINTSQQSIVLVAARLIVGTLLVLFNLWVKVNAHNTIKDYAWYWGDFFFRQINNEELIFDGVFEMVPHPMYSVGYVGYYGLALISKSYTVLVISLFGHFLQMIFLHYIENPHIDKIYGPSKHEVDVIKITKLKDLRHFDNVKPLVGLWNFNLLRASDLNNLILVVTYSIIIPYILSPISPIVDRVTSLKIDRILFATAISIKLFESVFINVLLFLQSYYKTFTKWYLYNNISVEKSLGNWAVTYNTLITLTYSSFFGWNFHQFLSGFDHTIFYIKDWFYLRVFLGITLILTQVWINSSIIDLLGYFGWFYGDFFIPTHQAQKSNLTKAGVYRYLNNPEQIFGVCGIMGATLIYPTFHNLLFCLLWVGNNFVRINFIEKPHMIKVYGENEVLVDSGVTKTFKRHLLPDVIQRRLSGSNSNKNLLDDHRKISTIMAGATDTLDTFIKELKNSNTRLTKQNIYELSQNLYFENSDYHLDIKGLNIESGVSKFAFTGEPIEIEWNAPENHSSKDWIGLYKTTQTSYSRYKTLISSVGRWTWVTESKGSYIFSEDKLFWEEGIYEFRYHLDGKHDVAYISEPFEIRTPRIKVPDSLSESENFALVLKENIFDKVVPDIDSIVSPLDSIIQKSSKIIEIYERLSTMISLATHIQVNFKIFLNNDTEQTILSLSAKIINMKKVLDALSYEKIELDNKKNV